MNLNQFYNDKARQEKIASETGASVQRILAKIAASANLDEKDKLSKTGSAESVANAAFLRGVDAALSMSEKATTVGGKAVDTAMAHPHILGAGVGAVGGAGIGSLANKDNRVGGALAGADLGLVVGSLAPYAHAMGLKGIEGAAGHYSKLKGEAAATAAAIEHLSNHAPEALAHSEKVSTMNKAAVDSGIINATQRDGDKFYVVDEAAQGIVAQNAIKPGVVHRVGVDGEGMASQDPLGGGDVEQVEKEAAIKTAGYIGLIEHVKLAANRDENLTKVACVNCGGSACGVCDGLGHMPKYAADRGLKFIDDMSTFVAAQVLAKKAAAILEAQGADSPNFNQAKQEIQAVQGIVDANFAPMLVGQAPSGAPDWGGEHIMQNRNVKLLSPNFHSY